MTGPGETPPETGKGGLPILAFPSAGAFSDWIASGAGDGLWLKIAKKGTGIASVTRGEAVDVALCHGWIDGQVDRFDETWFLQRITPRRARSKWSQVNRERVAALAAAGRMLEAGLAEVERAKADGRWDAAYPPASRAAVPADLDAALDADPAARTAFEALDGQNRYAILYRLHEVARPETRARRVATLVAMLARGETIHPPRRRRPAAAGGGEAEAEPGSG